MADPGFPVGGHAPIRGGVDLRHGHFSVKMYAKMKELGPIGGGVQPAHPTRSANGNARCHYLLEPVALIPLYRNEFFKFMA